MIDHVSIEVCDLSVSSRFYERLLKPLNMRIVKEFPDTIGYGKKYPEFWINRRKDMPEIAANSGAHICLRAPDEAAVDEFYRVALEFGGDDDGKPGLRPYYTKNYYAAFIRDPDGNRIEAVTFV
jgi:catechol 2,3-dioxygenase-like lactoylglutathione lyase family enzyme